MQRARHGGGGGVEEEVCPLEPQHRAAAGVLNGRGAERQGSIVSKGVHVEVLFFLSLPSFDVPRLAGFREKNPLCFLPHKTRDERTHEAALRPRSFLPVVLFCFVRGFVNPRLCTIFVVLFALFRVNQSRLVTCLPSAGLCTSLSQSNLSNSKRRPSKRTAWLVPLPRPCPSLCFCCCSTFHEPTASTRGWMSTWQQVCRLLLETPRPASEADASSAAPAVAEASPAPASASAAPAPAAASGAPAAPAARDTFVCPDVAAAEGTTPLHWACWGAHLSTCRLLFGRGADHRSVNAYGCNVAHWCGLSGDVEVCRCVYVFFPSIASAALDRRPVMYVSDVGRSGP